MKIIVIGGTGLIGSKLVSKLKNKGFEAIAASPSTGVNTITGEGLLHALEGADVVVDVANSPSFEDQAVLEFFETSNHNLLKAEKESGVKHHIALSVVGTDLLTEGGYFRAKLVQENLIKSSGIPYTIVRATQFFEFLNSIIQSFTTEQTVHVPTAFIQPIASDDVAKALLEVILEPPKNDIVDIAGPERFQFSEMTEKYLKETNQSYQVFTDVDAKYFGIKLNDHMLIPQKDASLGSMHYEDWLKRLLKK